MLEYDDEARPTYERLSSPKRLATFHDAGHYPFSDICALLGTLWDECNAEDDSWADVAEAQAHANTLTVAALEVELRQSLVWAAEAEAALAADREADMAEVSAAEEEEVAGLCARSPSPPAPPSPIDQFMAKAAEEQRAAAHRRQHLETMLKDAEASCDAGGA